MTYSLTVYECSCIVVCKASLQYLFSLLWKLDFATVQNHFRFGYVSHPRTFMGLYSMSYELFEDLQ